MPVVPQPEPDVPGKLHVERLGPAEHVDCQASFVQADSGIEFRIVKEHQSGDCFRRAFRFDLHFIGMISGNEQHRTGVGRVVAAGLHHEGTVLSARPLRIVFPGELPLRSGPVGREIVRERSGGFLFRRLFFRRTGNRGGPAVFGHGDGFDQRLPTQRVESPFIGVVNDVPLSVGSVDQRPVSFRTPALVRGVGMYQRIVRAVFPRAG